MTLFDYYRQGGPVMHLILLVSIVAMTIALERIYHFRRARTDHRKLLSDVKELLADDLVYKAIARCDADHGPVAHCLKTVIKNKDRDSDTISDAIDAAGLEEIPRLDRRVGVLATLANVATMLGLLGTIQGMIMTFAAIASTPTGLVNVKVLADGIWQAMITTAFGLYVAIPTTLAHAFVSGEIKKFAIAMEHSAAELVHFLEHQPSKESDAV